MKTPHKLFISFLFCHTVSLLSGCAEKPPQTYTDKEYGFSFTYPGNWRVKPDPAESGPHVVVVGRFEGGRAPVFAIAIQQPNLFSLLLLPKEVMQESIEEGGWDNVNIIDYELKQFSGKECVFIHYQGTQKEGTTEEVRFELFQFTVQHKDKMLIVSLMCVQDKFEKNCPIFDSIISSFQFDDIQNEQIPQEPEVNEE